MASYPMDVVGADLVHEGQLRLSAIADAYTDVNPARKYRALTPAAADGDRASPQTAAGAREILCAAQGHLGPACAKGAAEAAEAAARRAFEGGPELLFGQESPQAAVGTRPEETLTGMMWMYEGWYGLPALWLIASWRGTSASVSVLILPPS